jgi:hypothetical protein
MIERQPSDRLMKALWAATALAGCLGIASVAWHGVNVLDQLLKVVAYAIALVYWLKISGDHPKGSTMRTAWLLLAWSSGISIVRHAFEWAVYFTNWPLSIRSFVQFPTMIALALLIGGLFAIWFGFAAIGLGVRFRRSDPIWIAVMAILAFVPYLFSWRAVPGYSVIHPLVSLSPLLLAVPVLIALLLHRIEQEMGGGQLATSLRLIVASLLMRLVALTMNSPALASFKVSQVIVGVSAWTSIWFFTLAAAYRWRLTLSIRELTSRYQTDPETELAGLVLLAENQQDAARR